MRIGRTLPPAAAPIGWKSLFFGISAVSSGESELDRFSGELKEYFGKKHCFLVSSGKAALTLILSALKEQYPERDEVIIPAYTCYSVPSAVVRAGLEIKLCDLAEGTFDFNFEQLAPMLESEKLLCVLPTHLFGLPADVNRLKRMTAGTDVTIIEDAAQAMGGEWHGEKLGSAGDVCFFSLGRGKTLSTVEGGVVLTNNGELAASLKMQVDRLPGYTAAEISKLVFYAVVLNLLLNPRLFWIPKGLPFLKLGETIFDSEFSIKKMTAFQAGLAKNWVVKLREFRKVRQENTRRWMDILEISFCPFIREATKDFPELIRLPILLSGPEERDSLLMKSEKNGLGVAGVYPNIVSDITECADRFRGQSYPVAKDIAQRLVTFPVHKFLLEKDMAVHEKKMLFRAGN